MSENTPNKNDLTEEVKEQSAPEPFQSTIFTKHVYEEKKKRRFNGDIKRIVICAMAIVACVSIVASILLIIKLVPNNVGTTSSTTMSAPTESSGGTINSVDSSDGLENVKSFSVNNMSASYTFIPHRENFGEKVVTTWQIQGVDKSLTVSDSIASFIKNCLNIKYIKAMENTFDSPEEYYAYYGLSDSEATRGVVVQYEDGTEKIILVGSETPTNDGHYVTVTGDSKVYIVSNDIIDYYDYTPIEFANKTILTAMKKSSANSKYYNESDEISAYDYITISGSIFGNKPVRFEMSNSASKEYMPYQMTAPYNRPADSEFISKILAFAQDGMRANAVLGYVATEQNKKDLGLDKPKCVIECKIGEYKFKVIIGGFYREDSTELCMMIEGKTQIFSISAAALEFISEDYADMLSTDIVMENIYNIESVEFTDSTGKHTFNITHTPISGDEDMYNTDVKYKGQLTNTNHFKYLYQRVLFLTMHEFVFDADKSETVLKVVFKHIDDAPDTTLEITKIPNESRRYYVWVNGEVLGEVLKSPVEDIIENLAKYVAGQEVTAP